MENQTNICERAELFSSHWLLVTVNYLSLLWHPFAFSLTLYIAFSLKKFGLHQNAVIIWISYYVSVLLFHSFALGIAVYKTVRYYTYTTSCDLLISFSRCFIMRAPMLVGHYVSQFVLLTLVLERLASTYFFEDYEKVRRRSIIFILLALQWFTGVTIIVVRIRGQLHKVMPVCTIATSESSNRFNLIYVIFVMLQLVNYTLISILLKWNNRLKEKMGRTMNLSQKYQINENIRSLSVMIRLFQLYLLTYFIPGTTLLLLTLDKSNQVLFLFLTEVTMQPSFYGFAAWYLMSRDRRRVTAAWKLKLNQLPTIELSPPNDVQRDNLEQMGKQAS